jgi:hypothetical protein
VNGGKLPYSDRQERSSRDSEGLNEKQSDKMACQLSPPLLLQVLSIDVQPEPLRYQKPDNLMSRLTEAGMSAGAPGADCALSSDIVTSGRPLGRR